MYEGIEDIYQLLDAGRLKEALIQLQGIGMQTNQWTLRNQIENTLTAYGYMLQYAAQRAWTTLTGKVSISKPFVPLTN